MRFTILLFSACLMVPTVISQETEPPISAQIAVHWTFDSMLVAANNGNIQTFLSLRKVENANDNLKVLKIMESYKGLKFRPYAASYSYPGYKSIIGTYVIERGNEIGEMIFYVMMQKDSSSHTGWKITLMTSDDQ